MIETNYIPRNNFVLCEIVPLQTLLAMPDIAAEGKGNIVKAIGPQVKDLEIGDQVMIIGAQGVAWSFLPGTRKLFIINEENVVLKITRGELVTK